MTVFVSHIREEAGIAEVLRDWLHAAFPKLVSAFVSSDYEDNPLGYRWLDMIDCALSRSCLVLSLLSAQSMQRMWIHLEAGWAIGRQIHILPICHGGATIASLPRPYSDYGGAEVEQEEFAMRLLGAVKRHLDLDHEFPQGMLTGFSTDVRDACTQAALRQNRVLSD